MNCGRRVLILLLLLAADVSSAPFSKRWSTFNRSNKSFQPFRPRRQHFSPSLKGFSNIFHSDFPRLDVGNQLLSRRTGLWNDVSQYNNVPGTAVSGHQWPMINPLVRTRAPTETYTIQPLRYWPQPRPQPLFPVPRRDPPATARHQFYRIEDIETGDVPTVFLTDAETHGLVCIPASSLGRALAAGHQDAVSRSSGRGVTEHRTVVSGQNGDTVHSTRITSEDTRTVIETRTNDTGSGGVHQHHQSVDQTGTGLVRSSTGTAYIGGRPGEPSFADVLTQSNSASGNSRSHATASGHGVPSSSSSHSASGLDMQNLLPEIPLIEVLPQAPDLVPEDVGTPPEGSGDVAMALEQEGTEEETEHGVQEEEEESRETEDGRRETEATPAEEAGPEVKEESSGVQDKPAGTEE